MLSHSRKVNKQFNVILLQKRFRANAWSFKNRGWSKRTPGEYYKARRSSGLRCSYAAISTNDVVDIFDSNGASTSKYKMSDLAMVKKY